MNIGDATNVRLFTHKSFRHYGGREIATKPHIVKARLVATQEGHQKYIVELMETNKELAFPIGHKIAICENDFNIS